MGVYERVCFSNGTVVVAAAVGVVVAVAVEGVVAVAEEKTAAMVTAVAPGLVARDCAASRVLLALNMAAASSVASPAAARALTLESAAAQAAACALARGASNTGTR